MSEHLRANQIEYYDKRLMSPADLLAASEHLALCEECREQFKPGRRISVIVDSLQADLQPRAMHSNHLTYEQSAACVDECLGDTDREIVESHLELCSSCRTEIADLRAFRAEMTTYPETERLAVRPSTLRENFIAFWRVSAFGIPVQLAAAASVVLLCVLIATLLLRRENSNLSTQVSERQQPNETTQVPVPPGPGPQPPTAESQQTPGTIASAGIVAEIHDGSGVVTLDKEGNLSGLESLPLSYQNAVKAGLTNKRVDRPSELQGLAGRTGSLMGGSSVGSSFSLVGPIGTVVKTDRPTFRWHALSGATAYTITVYDSSFNKVASSQPQPGTEWTPSQTLERGGVYSWQVTAIREGKEIMAPTPPAPDAKFKVLEISKLRELEQARQGYGRSHLVLGILYERAGLLDDAEREFKTLYVTNPKSPVVRKLLRDVKTLREPLK